MNSSLLNNFKKYIPPLNSKIHKGCNGRIGIIGGSQEYTGAPYFAAISALKAGADLVHVFCSRAAGPVIKGFSPELIVHSILDTENAIDETSEWMKRLHALVIGPGLGRDDGVLNTVRDIIEKAPVAIPIVLDADGLFLLTHFPGMRKTFKQPVIFTPNAIEFLRMLEYPELPNGTYLKKGEVDEIWEQIEGVKEKWIKCEEEGSLRRCGGQGDILSGITGLFAAWVSNNNKSGDYCMAAFAAAVLTRRCSNLAFEKYKRGMLASKLIEFIPDAFYDIFENANS